jgi:hypothetical protein
MALHQTDPALAAMKIGPWLQWNRSIRVTFQKGSVIDFGMCLGY